MHIFIFCAHDVGIRNRVTQGLAVHRRYAGVEQTGTVELAKNGNNAAGTMHVFNVILLSGRCNLAQTRHLARNAVNVRHREIDATFLRRSQHVQHGIGGTAH